MLLAEKPGLDVIMPNHTFLVKNLLTRGYPFHHYCCNVTAPFNGIMDLCVYNAEVVLFKMEKAGKF